MVWPQAMPAVDLRKDSRVGGHKNGASHEATPATLQPAEDPEAAWWGDLEYVWSRRVRGDAERLERIARELRRQATALLAYQEGERDTPPLVDGRRDPARTRERMGLVGRRIRGSRAYLGSDGRRVLVGGAHGAASIDGRRVELLVSAEWCEARAAAMAMARRHVVDACRGRWRKVGCGCGVRDIEVGCDQPMLCEWCRRRHWRKWRRRLVRAMSAHLRAAVEQWERRKRRGPRPGIYLVTLTVPHSGSLERDRKVIGRGWRAISKAASYGGYEIRDADGKPVRYSTRKWWGHHALVYEVTPGTEGDGHMHAHVAVVSQWVPYYELRDVWQRATGSVVVDIVSPGAAAARAKKRGYAPNQVATAGAYLAKYVTKGVDPREFTGRKAGELLVAFRGMRKVTTSEGFWRPLASSDGVCTGCGERHVLVEGPESLQEHAPHAVLASMAERTRWRDVRGSPQVGLRWQS